MEITIFKDIKQTSQPFYRSASVVLDRIKEGASRELVKQIRDEKEKEAEAKPLSAEEFAVANEHSGNGNDDTLSYFAKLAAEA